MNNRVVTIIGASGYIGRHLVTELQHMGVGCKIKMLSRTRQQDLNTLSFGDNVEIIEGDLSDPDSLKGVLEPGSTVINLVYLWDAGEAQNLAVIKNLLDACKAARIDRLIHCSTAAVVGRVHDDRITEETLCHPVTEYGITKLNVEELIISTSKGYFDSIILRPTSVFGPEGNPLKKLASDLVNGGRIRNYFKSCLFDRRRMNLVHVANVVASIIFFINSNKKFDGEIFIVSDDDIPSNNFADVEKYLMREFCVSNYRMPRLPIPLRVLRILLACLGRNNINPCCNFAPNKLLDLGFERPVSFEAGLAEYAAWYRTLHIEERNGKNV